MKYLYAVLGYSDEHPEGLTLSPFAFETIVEADETGKAWVGNVVTDKSFRIHAIPVADIQ